MCCSHAPKVAEKPIYDSVLLSSVYLSLFAHRSSHIVSNINAFDKEIVSFSETYRVDFTNYSIHLLLAANTRVYFRKWILFAFRYEVRICTMEQTRSVRVTRARFARFENYCQAEDAVRFIPANSFFSPFPSHMDYCGIVRKFIQDYVDAIVWSQVCWLYEIDNADEQNVKSSTSSPNRKKNRFLSFSILLFRLYCILVLSLLLVVSCRL